MTAANRLTSAQAAARLGVKTETLYAYVSRGRLTRLRDASGSSFDPLEVEALARRRGPRPAPAAADAGRGAPLMVLDTDIALVEDDRLYLRGRDAQELAREHGLESVAAWLWGEPLRPGARFALTGADAALVHRVRAALPASASLLQRAQGAVLALAADDPFRAEGSRATLGRIGARAIAGAAAAVSGVLSADDGISVAERLAAGWGGGSETDGLARALNAALVLLIDHDLAVSTLAARAAASARASGYAVVTTGLGALDSTLHGNASQSAARLIERVLGGAGAREALAEALALDGRALPGFGHPLYSGTDARAAALLSLLRQEARAPAVLDAVDALAAQARERTRLFPNVDLALGALVVAHDLPRDAGTALFGLARSAGWIAHAIDEYAQPPLRLRPQGRYVERPGG